MSHVPDTNDDGVGDCGGLIRVLPVLRELGFTDVWLAPFFRAGGPGGSIDGNYDVSDYFSLDPRFGTMDDFDRLRVEADRVGVRLLGDLVPAHTSDHHPHFLSALVDPSSPYRRWYYFVEGSPNAPPSALHGIFGDGPGSAWTWRPEAVRADGGRGVWTLNLFYPGQPALNWHEPAVAHFMESVLDFWADRGLAGVRIDSAAHIVLSPDITTAVEPLVDPHVPFKYHRYEHTLTRNVLDAEGRNMSACAIASLVAAVRRRHPSFYAIVENSGVSRDEQTQWTDAGLHVLDYGRVGDEAAPMAVRRDPQAVRSTIEGLARRWRQGKHYVTFDMNHDFVFSRVDPEWVGDPAVPDPRAIRLLYTLVVMAPASACILYGLPLGGGLEPVPGDTDVLRRATLRRVIQWDGSSTRGYSNREPAVYPFPSDPSLNVAAQRADPRSTLTFVRRLIELRAEHGGDASQVEMLPALGDVVAYRLGGCTVWMNIGTVAVDVERIAGGELGPGLLPEWRSERRAGLDPLEVVITRRDRDSRR